MKKILTIISLILVLLTFSNCYFLHLTRHKIPIPDSIIGVWEETGEVDADKSSKKFEVERVDRFTVDITDFSDGDSNSRLTFHKIGNYTFASFAGADSEEPMTLLLSEMSEQKLTFRKFLFNKTDSSGFEEASNDIKQAYFISTVQQNGITAEEVSREYFKKYTRINGK